MGNGTGRRRKKVLSGTPQHSETENGAWGEPQEIAPEDGRSRLSFADAEGSSVSQVVPAMTVRRCKRCSGLLGARENYCRDCYDERHQWMPCRPTRKKRPRSVRPSERGNIDDRSSEPTLFRPRVRSHGEGNALPLGIFSNLPSATAGRTFSSSSESSETVLIERKNEWLKRRVYHCLVTTSTDSNDSFGMLCVLCGRLPASTVVIHGSTAHGSLCHLCGPLLLNKSCPWCGYTITESRTL